MKTFKSQELRFSTVHDVFAPRFSDANNGVGEWQCLIPLWKIQDGTAWQVVRFTKSPNLRGKRYCINRTEALQCPITNVLSKNKNIVPMATVPKHLWHSYDTVEEVQMMVDYLFPETV